MDSKDRLKICNGCQYKKVLLNNLTCGTPIYGETIIHEGKEVKLCGCIMKFKTLIPSKNCPIKKW